MNKLLNRCFLWNRKYKFPRVVSVYALSTGDTFRGVVDRYKGVTIDLKQEKCDQRNFCKILEDSLAKWEVDQNRCIWFKINITDTYCIPTLAEKGFNFHHARDGYVMMYKWLPEDSQANLPPSCHTNLGVGAMVFNKKNQILAISEKHYEYPHWKLPGGYVERGEDIIDAAIREVKEETGVDSIFESIVTFRHNHNMMFGNSDVYIIMMMKAISETIEISEREVNSCQWMDVEEYCNHPDVHYFNRFIVRKALEYKSGNLKLDLEKRLVRWAQYAREMNFLIVKKYH